MVLQHFQRPSFFYKRVIAPTTPLQLQQHHLYIVKKKNHPQNNMLVCN